MKVSIVIPAYNEEALLGETLEAVQSASLAFKQRGWKVEVIVCDNNSVDRTAEVARAGGVRVVSEPVNQIGRARNTGASAATGDWLLFIDADSHPSFELLQATAEAIGSGNCLAGGTTVCFRAATFSGRLGASLWNWISRSVKWMAGAFIFVETEAFRQIGGFSDELYISEEIDLSRRLKRLARQRRRKVIILHGHPLSTSLRKLRLYSRWEHARFLLRLLLSLGGSRRDPGACFLWYDGRR